MIRFWTSQDPGETVPRSGFHHHKPDVKFGSSTMIAYLSKWILTVYLLPLSSSFKVVFPALSNRPETSHPCQRKSQFTTLLSVRHCEQSLLFSSNNRRGTSLLVWPLRVTKPVSHLLSWVSCDPSYANSTSHGSEDVRPLIPLVHHWRLQCQARS